MACSCVPTPGTAGVNERILCLIGRVSEKLMAAGHMLGTAESCTGGLVAARCTDISGSSGWVRGGVIAYANEVKIQVLGVAPATIAEQGAVSKETVEEMATGALQVLGVDVAVAVSGIAGPTGGSPEKPVGTVWVAAAARGGATVARCFCFAGNREEIRLQAVEQALVLALAV